MIVRCDQSWDENGGCALIRCLKRGSTCMLERGNERGALCWIMHIIWVSLCGHLTLGGS